MSSKTNNHFIQNSSNPSVKHLPVFLVLSLVIFPLLVAAFYNSFQTFRHLHNFTLSRRQTIAFLAAITLKEKLDRIIDVGLSLSTRVQFRKLVESGKWDEAIKIMESVPKDFSYIDRVSLFDSKGTLWAATSPTPEILALLGKNFSYRDYYQGVSKNWQPYVSESFKPAVPLGYNLFTVAIPIKSEPSQKILGILLLSSKLDTVLEWSKKIDVGPGGFVYIVDQKGHLVAHPTLLSEKDIVDFSSEPAVQKVLKGERGVEVLFDTIEKEQLVSAYEPVSQYGWGVVAVQPSRTAFIERNGEVDSLVTIWTLVIFAVGFFTYRLLRNRMTIEAQRDRERILLESVGDGLVAIDRDWNITLWNKSAGKISGWSKEEAFGKPLRSILKFVRERDRTENINFIETAMVLGKIGYMENNTILIRKDGLEIPVGDSAAPIFDSKGKITGAIIIFRDISKERESQLLRSDFTYASHQLRTPVNKAIWSIETALEEKMTGILKERMQDAYLSMQSVQKLMEKLLLISEIDQGIAVPKITSLKLTDAFDPLIKEALNKVKKSNIALAINPISATASISTDPKLLNVILTEILNNAIGYNRPDGEIRIDVSIQDANLLVEIQDSGIGIPADQQSLIFTKFFRGTNVDTTKSSGAGLGLFICREYAKLLKGKIWFKSEEGKGTTFWVSFPVNYP